MATLSIGANRLISDKRTFTVVKESNKPNFASSIKKAQLNELKEALKEALLIKSGKKQGNPISTLWDE